MQAAQVQGGNAQEGYAMSSAEWPSWVSGGYRRLSTTTSYILQLNTPKIARRPARRPLVASSLSQSTGLRFLILPFALCGAGGGRQPESVAPGLEALHTW